MKRLLVVLASLAIVEAAHAGPNAGGTVFVHEADVEYTGGRGTYCGMGAAPSTCQDADTRVDGSDPVVWKVYAAFPPGSSPRLKALAFGVIHDGTVLLGHGACAEFELADPSWPAPGTGTALVFTETRTTEITECYWFAGYLIDEYGVFSLRPHPEEGGVFADDDIPSSIDEMTGYGELGFNRDGETACPAPGACCFPDGSCVLTYPRECQGEFLGGPCHPSPCPIPPEPGACCFYNGECFFVYEWECLWDFFGGPCDPNPCLPIRVQQSSWGRIKSLYH